jgi:hypothetical protein
MKPAGFGRDPTGREQTRQSILDPAFNRLRLRLRIGAKEKPRQFAPAGRVVFGGAAGEKERRNSAAECILRLTPPGRKLSSLIRQIGTRE